ncbi:tetratricopeptide repeat protein [Chryseolinea sp. H1M3-3]|uniref:tetratricopeptide repeat protein n=1 Tax=Chryseolinea sp. H1M3-3 TaxID=3034144 RepID=UPI0023EAD65D|nr:tetratricopeptide repeat protein [Chryseolinea sp. H1M3-3]
MKFILVSILAFLIIDPTKIAKINSAKKEAREAYMKGEYKKAAAVYAYLADSLEVREDEVMLNLAHSHFQNKDTANAIPAYQSLTASAQGHIRSKAQQQLGILNHQQGKLKEALGHFKEAIKADNSNVDAKYNYELLKKKLDEQKKKEEEKNRNKPKEPSAYAKKLKQQADDLVARFKFSEAENLMNEGVKRDQSVLYYDDFINRLKEVITIDKSKSQ